MVHDGLVQVIAAEESIAVGREHLKNPHLNPKDGNIKRATTEVINGNGAAFIFVLQANAVSQA